MREQTTIEQVQAIDRSPIRNRWARTNGAQGTETARDVEPEEPTTEDALGLARELAKILSNVGGDRAGSKRHDVELARSLALHVVEILADIEGDDGSTSPRRNSG